MMSGPISAQDLSQLKQAMFLGLARQPLRIAERLQSLAAAPFQREPALTLLALAGQRQRFERPSIERAADGIPEAARRLHQDQRPIIPEPARRLLLRLGNGVEKALADAVVCAAVRRVMRAGFRLHPFDLPRLISHIKGDAKYLGLAERAYVSLADVSSKTDVASLLHAEITAENWTGFPKGHRVAFLREERRKDPTRARDLLESVFKSEPAAMRADLLAALDVGLGADDLPFLESLTADRAETVRSAASRLTASVPGTAAFAGRLAEAAHCFARHTSAVSGILKRVGLVNTASVVFTPPKRANQMEQRAALTSLFDGFSVTEIAGAAALTAEEVVAALPTDANTVLTALSNRAVRDGDEKTMVRLIAHRLSSIDGQRFPVAPHLQWLAENLTGSAPAEFGKTLLGSAAWQAVVERLQEATTPAAMKDDGTLIWTAAVLSSGLLATFQEAISGLLPVTTRSARDFTDLVLTLDTLKPR
jgi:Family of unknown function (DUF5691)